MKRILTLLIAGIVCLNAAFPANSIEKGRRLRIVSYNVGQSHRHPQPQSAPK